MASDLSRAGPVERDIEQAIIALKKGAYLVKYGTRGKPKFCPFRLSNEGTVLIWFSGKEEKHLKLSHVSRIISGQRTPIFQRYPRPEKEYQSFSLIHSDRSLDLICKDKDEAEVWFSGLKALISRYHQINRSTESTSEAISPRTSTQRSSPLLSPFSSNDCLHKDGSNNLRFLSPFESPPQLDKALYEGFYPSDSGTISPGSDSMHGRHVMGMGMDGFRDSMSSAVSGASGMGQSTTPRIVVDDNTKRTNDNISQEVEQLRSQVESLTRKAQFQEIELERRAKQLKEETTRCTRCSAAKEVINSLTAQLKDIAEERLPVGTAPTVKPPSSLNSFGSSPGRRVEPLHILNRPIGQEPEPNGVCGNGEAEKEKEWIKQYEPLKKGSQLLKYGRKGKPKFYPFRLSSDEKCLIWISSSGEKRLKLASVSKIVPGQRTTVFQRYLRPEKDYLSFSLLYNGKKKSLDLICKDKVEAEAWIGGLRTLISTEQGGRSKIDVWSGGNISVDASRDVTSISPSSTSASTQIELF